MMNNALDACNKPLGAHVDCVFSSHEMKLGEEWSLKASGEWAAFTPGVYTMGEKLRISGWPDWEPKTKGMIDAMIKGRKDGSCGGGRFWHGGQSYAPHSDCETWYSPVPVSEWKSNDARVSDEAKYYISEGKIVKDLHGKVSPVS